MIMGIEIDIKIYSNIEILSISMNFQTDEVLKLFCEMLFFL